MTHSRAFQCPECHASDCASWYAVQIASGGLTLRCTRWDRPETSAARPPQLRPAGPLGFPAEEVLKRHGYRPFVPVESIFIRRNKYRKHEKMRVKRALIPGLVFLHLVAPVDWFALSEVPMVTGVFGLGGRPYRFAPAAMARLIQMSEDLRMPEYYRPMPTRRTFEVGDDVVDTLGRFDMPLKVVSITGETARVLGKLFGSEIEMTARVSQLAKAS